MRPPNPISDFLNGRRARHLLGALVLACLVFALAPGVGRWNGLLLAQGDPADSPKTETGAVVTDAIEVKAGPGADEAAPPKPVRGSRDDTSRDTGKTGAESEAGAKADPEADPDANAAGASQMSRLFPIGRDFKGVRIPSYTGDTLSSVVTAETMRRLDEERLDLEQLVITSFGAGEEADTRIYMDRAIYDMTTEKLTSKTPTRIVQPRFEMTGDKMVFDNKTQIGHMIGNVKMLIFEVDHVFSGGMLGGEGTE